LEVNEEFTMINMQRTKQFRLTPIWVIHGCTLREEEKKRRREWKWRL